MKRKILFLTLGILPLPLNAMNLNNSTIVSTEIKNKATAKKEIIKYKGVNKFEHLSSICHNDLYQLSFNHDTIDKWAKQYDKNLLIKILIELIYLIRDFKSSFKESEDYAYLKDWNEDLIKELAHFIYINFAKIREKTSYYGVIIQFYISHSTIWNRLSVVIWTILPQFAPNYHDANIIEDYYKFLAHNQLKVGISRHEWEKMKKIGPNETKIYELIKNFPQLDKTGSGGYISNDNIHTLAKAIIGKMSELENKFENSTTGWKVVTYTDGTRISLEQE